MESSLPDSAVLEFFDATVRWEMTAWSGVETTVAAATGLRLGSFSALRVIARRARHCRIQDTATDLGITIGAASKITDRLERLGHISRRPHESDGRSWLLAVTPTGRDVLNRGLHAMTVLLRRQVSAVLTPAEVAATTALLFRLTQAWTAPTVRTME